MDLDDDELRATKILNGVYGNIKCINCVKFHNCELTPQEDCENYIKKLNINKEEFTEWIENRGENIK